MSNTYEVATMCRDCFLLVDGEEGAGSVRWVTCEQCVGPHLTSSWQRTRHARRQFGAILVGVLAAAILTLVIPWLLHTWAR